MLEFSGGKTVAPPHVVVRREIEVALGRYFPGRIVPVPFQFLGVGLAHAAGDMSLDVRLEWLSDANDMPTSRRTAIKGLMLAWKEHQFLSGVQEIEPLTDLTAERQFRASLDRWRGAKSKYPPNELEREIYTSTLSDIDEALREALARHEISSDEFALLGETRCWALLDDMPSRRADMHLKRQWAKNADLPPRDSDLIDWAFLAVAVSYCDIVVTENQMADLFSRGFDTRATVISQLSQLPELLE
ncbi:hypothetical protein HY346_00570 [Candidatus Microgenomates bacterium]|nr:hypothetical protein [Candidatus Microgenomates bacterium]